MDIYYEIRRRYNNNESIRSIANALGISRQTVKKYCSGDTHPENRKEYHRDNSVITDEVVDFVRECLKSDMNYRNNHKVSSRSNTVLTDYQEELKWLASIPRYRYDTSRTASAKVNDYSTVRFEKNNYSVPVKYLRRDTTVKGYATTVHIHCDRQLVATFDRSYGQGNTQYKLEHYIDLIETKPRSVFQAKPVRNTVAKELLDWGSKLPGGNAEMVKLLRLCVDHGEEKILKIKAALPKGVIPTVDVIRSQLHMDTESNIIYMSNEIEVTHTDLKAYDKKCGVANE